MFTMLEKFLTLRVFPLGRRLFAMQAMRPLVVARNNTGLLALVDAAIAHDVEVTQKLDARWQAQRGKQTVSKPSSTGVAIDRMIDDVVSGMDRVLDAVASLYGASSPQAESAALLSAAFFPAGVSALMRSTWVTEVAEGRRIAQLSRTEPLRAHVERLGMGQAISRLAELCEELNTVLQKDPDALTFDEVRGARELGQGYLHAVVAKVLGDYPMPNAEDEAARAELLAPIIEQDDQIVAYQRRRRALPDVDPNTGEVVAVETEIARVD